ncbi:MAG: Uma2 family endonuclease, partial [Cyanobacteria bacterium J007]
RLGIRFDLSQEELQIDRPDGDRFLTTLELDRLLKETQERAQQAEERAQLLADRLREMGIDPDTL